MGGAHTHIAYIRTPPSQTHTHTCMQTTTNAAMGTETRLSKRRRRKRERLEDDRAHAKEMTEFRLAQYIASGRAGRCFREPRDDLSVYGAIFGPEKEPIVKGPILWWKQHDAISCTNVPFEPNLSIFSCNEVFFIATMYDVPMMSQGQETLREHT